MFCKNSTILASCFAVALSMFCSASRFAKGFSDRIINNTGACAITISLTSTSNFEVGSYSHLFVYTYSFKNHGKYSSKNVKRNSRKTTRPYLSSILRIQKKKIKANKTKNRLCQTKYIAATY